jgi:hypothetical protein
VGAGLWQDASMTRATSSSRRTTSPSPIRRSRPTGEYRRPHRRDKAHAFFNLERVMVTAPTASASPRIPS